MTNTRDRRSLDGTWQVRLDPDDVGLADAWQVIGGLGFDRGLEVPLPWQAADPSLRQYAGAVWYRRAIDVPVEWADRAVFLRFGAVDYAARVWVNGYEVGGHEGGYTPFELEVGQRLRFGGHNEVVLRAFDPADLDDIPHGKQGGGWYTPISGPWQPIELIARPPERVERVRLFPDAPRGVVRVEASCLTSAPHRVIAQVLEPGVEPDGEAEVARAEGLVSHDAPGVLLELTIPSPRLWSLEDPYIYTVAVSLFPVSDATGGAPLDELRTPLGLRTIEAREGGLYLNGEPLYLRGALDQAYWPDSLYTVPSDAEIEREIRLAKAMGLNLLRKHIKPEDPRYLDACDRLGMLVWAEPANPTNFAVGAKLAVRRDLFEMIDRDFNHPCVVIWSLYNEDWGLPNLWSDAEKQTWLRDLYREVKRHDPTRPVCDNSGWAHVATDLNDYHEYYATPERIGRFRERLDFILRHPEDNYAADCQPGGEPVLVSEFGHWGLVDPKLLRQRAGGEPAWFHYDRSYARAAGLPPLLPENRLTDGIKTIDGFEERFRAAGLRHVFPSTGALCQHLQRRAFRSLKAQIEEMRGRPEIKGYVVTELTDVEWEGNGWLDYWRQPKSFFQDLAGLNAPLALIARPERPSYWADEAVDVSVCVANSTPQSIKGVVRWRLEGSELEGEMMASATAHSTATLPTSILFPAPGVAGTDRLLLELVARGVALARSYVELAFAPRGTGLVPGIDAGTSQVERVFRQRLERQGYRIPRAFSAELPLLVTRALDGTAWDYAERGGRVLYLAERSTQGAERAAFRFHALEPGESWRMASGGAWARVDRLAPTPLQPELGWEAAGIFPLQSIDAATLGPRDEQLAGYFEGWLANAGAFAVLRRVGDGWLLATTFRFAETYGLDPTATLLLNRLAAILLEAR